MGLFSRIKTILFEDDDVEDMPVYTSEDVKEPEPEPVVEPVVQQEEVVKVDDNSRFKNVKRDIDLNFDDDVLGEVPGALEVKEEVPPVQQPVLVEEPKVEEPKGFTLPSFDEDEFERINSRLTRNEEKEEVTPSREIKRDRIDVPFDKAKAANSNFSSTRDTREEVETGTIVSGKKPFTPSPVISPVYGILDKNYSKDDIKDKKGGLKREKIVKPIVKKEEAPVAPAPAPVEEPVAEEDHVEEKTSKINIDSVRKKAYGELENLEKTIEQATREFEEKEKLEEKAKPVETPKLAVEAKKETEAKVDKVVEEVIPEKVEKKDRVKPQILDDVEKTSTLQILDDIEKELNSIKPISKEEEEKENKEIKEKNLDDTLENDLFNLIDSMYEEGEDEEDD